MISVVAKGDKFCSQHCFLHQFSCNFISIANDFYYFLRKVCIFYFTSPIIQKKRRVVVQKQKLTQNVSLLSGKKMRIFLNIIYNTFFFMNITVLNTFSATTKCCTDALLTIYDAFIYMTCSSAKMAQ